MSKIDLKSVSLKVWFYFVSFAAVLMGLIWVLQIVFLNAYYEQMKISEIGRISNQIESQFYTDDDELSSTIQDLAIADDVYVIIETVDGAVSFSPNTDDRGPMFSYQHQISSIREALLKNGSKSVSVKIPDMGTNTKTLAYAKCLYTDNISNYLILYIFSPLYPVDSTVNILRTQLIYVTAISLILSLLLSFYLTKKISNPLSEITRKAVQLGKGNYDINFRTGGYTEIDELASTLNTVSYELAMTDQYQKDLIANVSHDLKTPLTMIKSYAEMIRDLSGDNPEKRTSHLQVIIDETDRLNQLVSDMLSISRMRSRQIELSPSEFCFNNCLSSVLESYNILCENEGYRIVRNIPARRYFVVGDEVKLKQVINNLLTNAIKYCGEDKLITVTLKKVNKKIRFEVRDNGVGIKKDELPHVWERYYKSSTHHVRATEGSGLGLSICKEILNLHKCTFGVNSRIGKGSTFWFEIDIAKTENSSDAPKLSTK